jgi:predicted GIY-YIG superfamily endonuclease
VWRIALSCPKQSEGQVESPEKTLPAYLYILRLRSGQLYTGSTTNLDQRYKDHFLGKACRTTRLDPPSELVYSEEIDTFSEARKREAQIKKWSRAKKEAPVSGNITEVRRLSKRKYKI